MTFSTFRRSPHAARFGSRLGVATIFMANAVLLSNWIARIPDVKQRLQLSESRLGLALLCMAAGALLAQLLAGYMIGRFGSRRVTMVMALLFCLVGALPGLAPSLPLLMLALFLVGAASGGLDVAMNGQAALVEEAYERPIMSSFHGLWSAGAMIGAAIGGAAAARGFAVGVHLIFAALCVLCVMLCAFTLLIPDSGHHEAGEKPPLIAFPPRALWPLGAVAFGALCCEGAVADWSAVYLRESLGAAPGVAALGFAAFSLTMTAGRLMGDKVAEKLGAETIGRGGGFLILLGVAGVAFGHIAPLAIAGFALIGAGTACLFPLAISAAARRGDMKPGAAIAAIATAGYTGFLLGPPLIGSVAQQFSLRWALALLALFGALILVFSGSLRASRKACELNEVLQ